MPDDIDSVEPDFVAPVEKNGGFTRDRIRLIIAKSNEALNEKWANTMTEHTKAMNEKLDAHEDLVTKRLDSQDASIAQTLAIVKKIDEKGDLWHREDMVFRVSTLSRMQKLEGSIKNLRVWIATVNAAMKLKSAVTLLVKEGKQVWVALAAFFGAWITAVQAINTIWPGAIHNFLTHHHLFGR